MSNDSLEVKQLTKTYQKSISLRLGKAKHPVVQKPAINKISFTLTPGLYGLLGPNGAGKSTLVSIITGNLQQDTGIVLWNGKNTTLLGVRFRRLLGYMPQQQGLYPSFTGRRFLSYFCSLKEIARASECDEVDQIAAMVNLSNELEKKISAYSGGMKQRLLLASSLIGNPKLLILDEPTAGLDPKERVRMRNMLHEISDKCIVIIATHVVSDVESVADRILFLKNGLLEDIGTPKELIEKYAPHGGLEDAYISIYGDEGDI